MLEDVEGKRLGVGAEAPGIGEDVERPRRGYVHPESDAAKPGHHGAPPLVEDLAKAQGVVAGFGERGQSRPLDELVGGDEEVAVGDLEGPHEFPRRDQISQSPARHGVGLGEPIEHEGVVGELENGMLRALVGEPVVDLVGDDPGPEPRGVAETLRRHHRARRIGGRVDEDRLAPRGEPPGKLVRPALEAIRRIRLGYTA